MIVLGAALVALAGGAAFFLLRSEPPADLPAGPVDTRPVPVPLPLDVVAPAGADAATPAAVRPTEPAEQTQDRPLIEAKAQLRLRGERLERALRRAEALGKSIDHAEYDVLRRTLQGIERATRPEDLEEAQRELERATDRAKERFTPR